MRRFAVAVIWIVWASASQASGPARLTIDCTARNTSCPELLIEGDVPFAFGPGRPSPFSGMADPSVRRDPESARLWMAYSWPSLRRVDGGRTIPAIETHLAFSVDAGKSWMSSGILWPTREDREPVDGGLTGFTVSEVPNLLPMSIDGHVTWIGARLNYFMPRTGPTGMRLSSFRIELLEAASVIGLATAPAQVLGARQTDSRWGIDVSLDTLSPNVADCDGWNEPALYAQGGQLYLALRCMRFARAGRVFDIDRSNIVVFATEAQGDVSCWVWRYAGAFADQADAMQLGGRGLTQIDFARARSGALLAVLTVDDWNPVEKDMHLGCQLIEMASIDPPRFARDRDGRLRVRATVTASDIAPPGPGACAYDPDSATGVLFVRRQRTADRFLVSLRQTGIRP